MKNEDWYMTGGYFKNGLFVSFTVISEKYKRATKTPGLSMRKRGLRERTEGTRTLDLRLDRKKAYISHSRNY